MPFKSREARRQYLRRWEKDTALRLKQKLLGLLGSQCQQCGSQEDLEFDHLGPTKRYESSRLSQLDRLRKYLREAERQELQVLCRLCNQKKGKPPPPPDEDVPF